LFYKFKNKLNNASKQRDWVDKSKWKIIIVQSSKSKQSKKWKSKWFGSECIFDSLKSSKAYIQQSWISSRAKKWKRTKFNV